MALAVPVTAPAVPVATNWSYSRFRKSDRSGSRSGRFWAFSSFSLSLSWLRNRYRHRCHRHRSAAPRAAQRDVPATPVELASDFDAEDPELRVEAAHSVGAFSLTSTRWPPQKLLTNTEELSPIKAETSVGRYTGSAPTFAKWPIYETKISEIGILEDSEELKSYKIVDFEKGLLTRAFVLASRWQKANLGRSAGFERQGIGILSGFKFTNPILMRQLQGLNVLQGYLAEKYPGEEIRLEDEELTEFLRHVEASDFIAEEFRAVAPAARTTHVTGLVSSAGSALAVWCWEDGDTAEDGEGKAEVQLCLGHDCLDEGPLVEERLLRLVAGRAAALGATSLRCRARFTEKGKLLVPCKSLGFTLAPGESQFTEDMSDAVSEADFSKVKDYKEIPEAVPGLQTWLLLLCLEDRIEAANEWCHEMGAATLEEVIESREDLADFLQEHSTLTPGEREALLERDR
eukprot:s2690_g10.t3